MISIHSNFICDGSNIYLEIRDNINGDYKKVEKVEDLSKIKAGSFVNLKWEDRNLMLPFSPIKGSLSFSDRKWDWRYEYNQEGSLIESSPKLYEIKPSGEFLEHICSTKEIN